MSCKVFVGNTNLLELTGLKSAVENAFVNDATVTVTVKDAAGSNVTGQTWPATVSYVDGSDGDYQGILEHDIALADGDAYVAHVDANAGTNRIGHWEFAFTAKTRRGV